MIKYKITIENISLILAILVNFASQANIAKNKNKHPVQAKKTAIIFELDSILFEECRRGYIKKIGLGSLARYKMSCWADPGDACLDMLEHISKNEKTESPIPVVRKGRKMPCCIHDLQCGKKSHHEVRTELAQHIEQLDKNNYFKSAHQKDVHKQLIDISLDPEQLPDIAKPNKLMMQLVKKLKQNGYKLYILTNLSQDQYKQLITKHADFVKLFDDIIISANIKTIKPDHQIYKHLLTKHKLIPQSCILIDNQKNSIEAAKKLGITGILWDNKHYSVARKLQELGVSY